MRHLQINVPSDWNCQVFGAICDSDNPVHLSEDMVEVALPNGFLISAGWTCVGDPSGNYVVTLTNGLQHVIPPLECKSAEDARDAVVDRINEYRWRSSIIPMSSDGEAIAIDYRCATAFA
jgi:hypothetical protein